MVSVILSWIYIFITAYIVGYGINLLSKKLFNYEFTKISGILFAGLCTATVYSQIYSLFSGVSMWANIVFLLICAVILFVGRKTFIKDFVGRIRLIRPEKYIPMAVLFLICVSFGAIGEMFYDSDLYHGQSIRWIEEYGVVKGLGNIHSRLAYNSSFFALNALYSFKFLTGRSLHTVISFMAYILTGEVLDVIGSLKRKKVILSDYARFGALYYLIAVCAEFMSPTSDNALMITVFYIVIRWTELIDAENEGKEVGFAPYGLLCVLGVYAMTEKLTAGLILLLVIKPVRELIKKKAVKETVILILMGLLVCVPWIVRNVYISGYLFYPVAFLDVLPVDWKIYAGDVRNDAETIMRFGRQVHDGIEYDRSVLSWFPNWYENEISGLFKFIIPLDMICCIYGVIIMIVSIAKKRIETLNETLLILVMDAGYLFWQLSAPLVRYGYVYIILPLMISGGHFIINVIKNKYLKYMLEVLVAILFLEKIVVWAPYGVRHTVYGFDVNPIFQTDYSSVEMKEDSIDGIKVYVPIYGDLCGYDKFPAVPIVTPSIRKRGDDIKDGFIDIRRLISSW